MHRYIKVLATRQAGDNKVYEVLQKDDKAHVVKINDCPRPGETQYGYVFFHKTARTPGPVRRVNKAPCIIMVEEVDNKNLYIAVSSPNLNFNVTRHVPFGSRINGDEKFYSVSMAVEIQVTMQNSYTLSKDTGDVRVDGKVVAETEKTRHVEVRPKGDNQSNIDGQIVVFKELVKGFSTEVKLARL